MHTNYSSNSNIKWASLICTEDIDGFSDSNCWEVILSVIEWDYEHNRMRIPDFKLRGNSFLVEFQPFSTFTSFRLQNSISYFSRLPEPGPRCESKRNKVFIHGGQIGFKSFKTDSKVIDIAQIFVPNLSSSPCQITQAPLPLTIPLQHQYSPHQCRPFVL